jgi:hypothetical protein
MSNIKTVLNKVSMMQIPENALLHGVVQALDGRQVFRDADNSLDEHIFNGDIFAAILGEQSEMGGSPFRIKDKKTLDQLEELAELIDTDYVMITKI